MGQAANLYEDPVNVENLFNTQLYTGDNAVATQTFNTGLNMADKGGMIWFKSRSSSQAARIIDTERGTNASLIPSSQNGSGGLGADGLTFLNNGFSIGWEGGDIAGANDYVAWSFRKSPKFFDVIAYEGNGQTSQTISHSLGSKPGMMIVKRTDGTGIWWVYHRHLGATKYLKLQSYETFGTGSTVWNNTEPTSTEFTVGNDSEINYSNRTYVAYLFAHNEGDGGFGLTKDQDIIKCGSYTVPSTAVFDVELGFEPQFVIVKATGEGGSLNQYYDWFMFDSMRGSLDSDDKSTGNLVANETTSEANNPYHNSNYDLIQPTPTGFKVTGAPSGAGATASNGYTYAYMAIRRPMATPTSATDLFDVKQGVGSIPAFNSGFTVDAVLQAANITSTTSWRIRNRLTNANYMIPNDDSQETPSTSSTYKFDLQTGYGQATNLTSVYAWMWKRAPGYFDVVNYTGDGGASTLQNHNLGVVPEMIWIKRRDSTGNWGAYHKALPSLGKQLYLDLDGSYGTGYGSHIPPTATQFCVGGNAVMGGTNNTNASNGKFIAYLFATLAGVSKVGSYTGNGSSQNIDCGFSSGARFVLIKKTSGTGSWLVYDTARGIVAGNDSQLYLDGTFAADSVDNIDPDNSGFIATGATNTSGETYIFYAIA